MFNICRNCGEYRVDKIIEPGGPYAVCPVCEHKHPFRQLPLLIVAGASGAGKSAAGQRLLGKIEEVVLLEGDLLWRPEFNRPQEKYNDFFETWLRLCKNVAQAGRPVALFNAGAIPANVEPCVERRYFSETHYLALVCDDDLLAQRLQRRSNWRGFDDPAVIEGNIEFNRWFKANAGHTSPPIELLDTSRTSVEETARQVAGWIRGRWAGWRLIR